jgi:hypothetical protein
MLDRQQLERVQREVQQPRRPASTTSDYHKPLACINDLHRPSCDSFASRWSSTVASKHRTSTARGRARGGARTPRFRPRVARKSSRCASASPAAGWPDKRQHGLRLAAKTCESQDAGTGHVSSRRLAPRTPRLGRSIWISRYGLNRDGRMARSASDATGPVESVSVVLAGLRHAQAGDRGGSWDGASGSG